jgi:hypothetical protein
VAHESFAIPLTFYFVPARIKLTKILNFNGSMTVNPNFYIATMDFNGNEPFELHFIILPVLYLRVQAPTNLNFTRINSNFIRFKRLIILYRKIKD